MVKGALALSLAEQGTSLAELEQALNDRDSEKVASMLTKTAGGPLDWIKGLFPSAKFVGQMGMLTSMLAGGVAGAGVYGTYKGLSDTKRRTEEADEIRHKIETAQQELLASRNQPPTM